MEEWGCQNHVPKGKRALRKANRRYYRQINKVTSLDSLNQILDSLDTNMKILLPRYSFDRDICKQNIEIALKIYSAKGDLDMFKSLVKYLKSIDILNIKWDLLGKVACEKNHVDIVKYILFKSGQHPSKYFEISCAKGYLDQVKYYLDEHKVYKNFGLNIACKCGRFDVVYYLIGRLKYNTVDMTRPLEISILYSKFNISQFLMEKGADYNSISEFHQDRVKIYYSKMHKSLYNVIKSHMYKDVVNLTIGYIMPEKFIPF
jgi:hypothetical protein